MNEKSEFDDGELILNKRFTDNTIFLASIKSSKDHEQDRKSR